MNNSSIDPAGSQGKGGAAMVGISVLKLPAPSMGSWQGSAGTSFQTLKDRWHQDATQLNNALRQIGDGLAKNRQTLRSRQLSGFS